MYTLTNHFI